MTAYLIGDVEITDPEGFGTYVQGVGATLDAFGARVVARAGRTEAPEGASPNGVLVVVAFESLEKLRAWYASPGYAELLKIRLAATRSHIFAVEGTDQAPTGGAAGYVIAQITVTDATRYEDYKAGPARRSPRSAGASSRGAVKPRPSRAARSASAWW